MKKDPNPNEVTTTILQIPNKEDFDMVETIITSFLENFPNLKELKIKNELEAKLKGILYLGFSYNAKKVKVCHTSRPNIWVEGVEFKNPQALTMPYQDFMDFINLLLENPNAIYLLEKGALLFDDINSCAQDANRQDKLGLLYNDDNCFYYIEKGLLTFDLLCKCTKRQQENLADKYLCLLVRQGNLSFKDMIDLSLERVNILKHPVIKTLLNREHLQVKDVELVQPDDLKNLNMDDEDRLTKFFSKIWDRKLQAFEEQNRASKSSIRP